MKLLFIFTSVLVAAASIYYSSSLLSYIEGFTPTATKSSAPGTTSHLLEPMTAASKVARNISAMSKSLSHARIDPRRSAKRGHADHGWLNTYHTFLFADYTDWSDERLQRFGSLRVLNEDRVAPMTGFPTHPHRDFEIFSYILSGELTHRDSMIARGSEAQNGASKDKFYRMRRGDVQFTTGGTGIAHSEQNEHEEETVHFLQIWALPWKKGLTPRYHTRTFDEEKKRKAFLPILSPLKAGKDATAEEEKEALPAIEETIPIHADFVMGAGLIGVDKRFKWTVGSTDRGDVVKKQDGRHVYVHVPMTKNGNAKVRLDGRESAVLSEGDGAFIENVNAGDVLSVESIGEAEAEVIILDSD